MSFSDLLATISPNTKFLWYLSRATGIVSLLLLGVIVLLGIATATKMTPKGFGKLVGPDLHRRLSITTVGFIAVHVVAAILDPFVAVGIGASLVPFVSKYRPLWVGLGTVGLDLILVVVATSLIRHRLNHGIWKKIHYLSWVIVSLVLFHALGTGSDTQVKLVEIVYVGFILAIGLAGILRVLSENGFTSSKKAIAGLGLLGIPLLLLVWATQGPLRIGWAKSATSFSLLPNIKPASSGFSTSSSSVNQPGTGANIGSFTLPVSGNMSGTLVQSQTNSGIAILTLRGTVEGTPDAIAVQLNGSVQEGSLVLESSTAYLGTNTKPNLYTGTVSRASGSTLILALTGPSGSIGARMDVAISGNSFSGTFSAPTSTKS